MATYNTGVLGISFRVDCSNSIVGTYPNIKHRVSYSIYLQHAYSENSMQYNGAILNFGSNRHSVNINVSGAGTWRLASGTLEYTFATNNRVDSRNIRFSTNFANVSASGSQTESATISIPKVKNIELSSTYNSISYKATLESNPYNFYTIKTTLDNASKIGTEGKFDGLTPNKEYKVNCYVRYRGDTSIPLENPISKSINTKKPNKPKAGKLEVSNITYKSAYISWSGFSIQDGATDYYYQSSTDGNNWIDRSKGIGFEVSRLSPNTEYIIYVRIVDNFGTPSDSVNVAFKTAKPDKPIKGSVTYTDLNPFGATFTWSGFQIKEGANSYYYQYSYDGRIWKDLQTQTKLVVDDLAPETRYSFYIRIVDDFGTHSDYANVEFLTPADQAKIAYHVIDYQKAILNQEAILNLEAILNKDGFEITDKRGNILLAKIVRHTKELTQAKVWYNDNGVIKKVKKIYFNDGNDIKVNINYGG